MPKLVSRMEMKKTTPYQERFYRDWMRPEGLVNFRAAINQTDLFICAERNLQKEATSLIKEARDEIEGYAKAHPEFLTTLSPIRQDPAAPFVVSAMIDACRIAGTGPMAAVAGAIAEFVGRGLLEFTKEIIVENGGDIFLVSKTKRRVGIFAGESIFSGKLAMEISPQDTPIGVSTSSGTIGHSLSFGCADAVCVLAKDAALSDAVATAAGNIVKTKDELKKAVDFAKKIDGIKGILCIKDDKLTVWGDIKLV